MKFLRSYLLLLAAVLTHFSFAQSRFSYEKYIDKGDTLLYRQLWPDANANRRYPLVIFLHGSGERGNDNEAQLKWGVQSFATDENMTLYPAIVIAPQCPANDSWASLSRDENMRLGPMPTKPMALLLGLIQSMKKTLPIDSNRIYITGLSMGGYGTFDAIERRPDLFAAAVPVCGAGDVSKASTIAHIPMWIFTGAEDHAVKPVHSLNMFQALTKAGANPGFTQYPEVGHFSWLMAYNDKVIMQWLFRQSK